MTRGLVLLALLVAACSPSVPEGRFACSADEDCPETMVCRTHVMRCYLTHADAGTRDGG